MEISSKHLHSKTVRAGELKIQENLHLPPPVTCHVSHATCQMSHVTCPFFFDKVVKLVGGGPNINRASPYSFFWFTSYQYCSYPKIPSYLIYLEVPRLWGCCPVAVVSCEICWQQQQWLDTALAEPLNSTIHQKQERARKLRELCKRWKVFILINNSLDCFPLTNWFFLFSFLF